MCHKTKLNETKEAIKKISLFVTLGFSEAADGQFGLVSLSNGISTFVGYLKPNPSL